MVPRDLSVIGFDDIPEASQLTPALTTVRQQMQSLGAVAAGLLISLMAGERPASSHLRLSTRLVARGTTGPPARTT